jgi:hypothetical protein
MSAAPGPATPEDWLGQEDLPWNILLVADLVEVPTPALLRERLTALSVTQGWGALSHDSVVEGERSALLARLAALPDHGHPVSVGRTDHGLVVRARHAFVDGLGLLAVLRELTGEPVRSTAAGVGSRPHRSAVRALASRLTEVAFRPPAPVAPSPAAAVDGDVFAVAQVPGSRRTADLAHATLAAVSDWNRRAGARTDRVALAVGVSTVGGADLQVAEHSGFIRIPDAQRHTRDELAARLAEDPLQVGGTARSGAVRRLRGVIRWASRMLAGRLGSTVLVSHLGRVESAAITGSEFYPFSGSDSGLSLGAVTTGGRTTVTLRARGDQQSAAGLERLLGDVVTRLG